MSVNIDRKLRTPREIDKPLNSVFICASWFSPRNRGFHANSQHSFYEVPTERLTAAIQFVLSVALAAPLFSRSHPAMPESLPRPDPPPIPIHACNVASWRDCCGRQWTLQRKAARLTGDIRTRKNDEGCGSPPTSTTARFPVSMIFIFLFLVSSLVLILPVPSLWTRMSQDSK